MTSFSADRSGVSALRWLIPVLCLLGAGALLGLSTNMAKFASQSGVAPLPFLSWSVLLAASILAVFSLVKRDVPRLSLRTTEYFFFAGFVTVAGSNLIFFNAVNHVGAGFVALVITLPPLLTYLGAMCFRIERFTLLRATGVLLAMGGAASLALGKLSLPDTSAYWVALALLGPVLLATGNLYRSLRWPPGESAEALAPGMLAASAIMLFTVPLFSEASIAVDTSTATSLLLIGLQGLIFAGQFLLMFILQRTGGPVLLSLLGAVGAIVGVPIAVLVLGEAAPENLLLGAGLIGAGIICVVIGGLRAKRAAT